MGNCNSARRVRAERSSPKTEQERAEMVYYLYIDHVNIGGNPGIGCNQGSSMQGVVAQAKVDAAKSISLKRGLLTDMDDPNTTCADLGYTKTLGGLETKGVTGWLTPSFFTKVSPLLGKK